MLALLYVLNPVNDVVLNQFYLIYSRAQWFQFQPRCLQGRIDRNSRPQWGPGSRSAHKPVVFFLYDLSVQPLQSKVDLCD